MEYQFYKQNSKENIVLILIIMEDTHGGAYLIIYTYQIFVLILIIMEDTHGEVTPGFVANPNFGVLILIIMEDTHGVFAGMTCDVLQQLS